MISLKRFRRFSRPKRQISAFLAIVSLVYSLISFSPLHVKAENALSLSASSAILIEADSGKVLYEQNAYEKRPQASTTKIMTAILALETCDPKDTVKVSAQAVGVEGSSVYLQCGEELSMEELVYALMLESANDAAAAIAYHISGGISEFADLMNAKAEELGLKDTHFTNPHGLNHDDHYTTAYDLAMLTSYAMQNDTFCAVVSTLKTYICTESQNTRLLLNHNRLLKSYEGAIGVKTGFTKASGRCLVSAAERDGLRLIAVTLNAPDDWNDHRALLDYGFSKYKSVTLLKSGAFSTTIPVVGGKESCVAITNSADAKATVEENENLSYRIELPKFVFGGFDRGDVIGRIVWHREDGTIAGEVPLVVTFGVERQIYRSFWQRILGSLFSF